MATGSGDDIYGCDPTGEADSVANEALSDLGESKSNNISGSVTDSRDSTMDVGGEKE